MSNTSPILRNSTSKLIELNFGVEIKKKKTCLIFGIQGNTDG